MAGGSFVSGAAPLILIQTSNPNQAEGGRAFATRLQCAQTSGGLKQRLYPSAKVAKLLIITLN